MTVLTDWVVEHIRAALRTRAMVPGATYSGYQLAADLGISRSPVRDGLLRLAATGLIEFTPNRGFRIIQPTETDIAEIYALRIAIEVPAARRAARILASQQGPGSPVGDVHDFILATIGSHQGRRILAQLRDQLLAAPQIPGHGSTGHQAIRAALTSYNSEAAGELMHRHLENAALSRLTIMLDDDPQAAANVWQRVGATEIPEEAARRRSC